MKTAKILLRDIKDSYSIGTGSDGAITFLNDKLNENDFDLDKPYNKRVENDFLVCEQE